MVDKRKYSAYSNPLVWQTYEFVLLKNYFLDDKVKIFQFQQRLIGLILNLLKIYSVVKMHNKY